MTATITHNPTSAGICGRCNSNPDRDPRKPRKPATWVVTKDGASWRVCVDCAAAAAHKLGLPFPPITSPKG